MEAQPARRAGGPVQTQPVRGTGGPMGTQPDRLTLLVETRDFPYFLRELTENDVPISRDALSAAVRYNQTAMIETLLDPKTRGVPREPEKFYTGSARYGSPFIEAIKRGGVGSVKTLLEHRFPITDNDLVYALENNHYAVLEFMLTQLIAGTVHAKLSLFVKDIVDHLYDMAQQQNKPDIVALLEGFGASSYYEKLVQKCERDEAGNIIDQVTQESVPELDVVAIGEFGATYCFDIKTLYKHWKSSGKMTNPFTNRDLQPIIVRKIQAYEQFNRLRVVADSGIPEKVTFEISRNAELGELLLTFNEKTKDDRFRLARNLKNFDLYISLANGFRSIYEFDLETEVQTLNLPVFGSVVDSSTLAGMVGSFDIKLIAREITLDPYREVILDKIGPRLYRYGEGKQKPWIYESPEIDKVYYQAPPPMSMPEAEKFSDLAAMIDRHRTDPTAVGLLAEMVAYIERRSPKISAIQSRDLIARIEEIRFQKSDDHIKYMKHLLYSRVVDKFRMIARPIEGLYIRSRYRPADWRVLYTQ